MTSPNLPFPVETVGELLPPVDLVLAFDTETTGLPLWHLPSDHEEQPRIVHMAAELCAPDGTVLEVYDQIVNIGVAIDPAMTAIHGITTEMSQQGISPEQMLADFFALVERASVVTGYNVSFDNRMVRIDSARHLGLKWDCPKPTFDTCFAASKHLNEKKVKLGVAVQRILGEDHKDAHRALADCSAARRLYFVLRDTMEPLNPRVRIGGNNPPPDEQPAPEDDGLTPFQRIKKEIEDLVAEAKNFLDGTQIETQGQADEIGRLRGLLQDAAARAEKLRKAEAKPFDDGKAEVQGRYNPLIQKDRGIVDMTVDTCNKALKPFLLKKEQEQRTAALEAQRKANEAAYEASRQVQESIATANLDQRQSAEQLLKEAQALLGEAKKADQAKPQVAGLKRAIGMKSVWLPIMKDPTAAIEYFRAHHPAELKLWMQDQAEKLVRAGRRDSESGPGIPGFEIREDRVPV